jgi:hypothetical protein
MIRTKTILLFGVLLLITGCWGMKDDCSNAGLGRTIEIRDMKCDLSMAQLYSAERGTNFEKLTDVGWMRLIPGEENDSISLLILVRNFYLMTPEYDYRLIVNDTLCFDFTNFVLEREQTVNSSEKKIRCILKSYDVNGVACSHRHYNYLDAPFKLAKVIK